MTKKENEKTTVDVFVEQIEEETFDQSQIDFFEDDDLALNDIIPTMNVTPMPIQEPEKSLISDDKMISIYDEILNNCREDRFKADQIQSNFEEMVINEGDATSSSKEALVNLMKIKTDINDKMSKIADLMTRHKLKDRDTFPRYLAAHQHNNVTIENTSKREILKNLQDKKRKGG